MRYAKHIKKKSIKKPSFIWISIAAVLLVIAVVGGIFAKYVFDKEYLKNKVGAKDFYFTVDILGDTTTVESLTRDIHIYGGEEATVTFTVQNFFDSLRITEYNLTYDVSVECDNDEYSSFSLTPTTPTSNSMTGGTAASQDYTLTLPGGYTEETIVTVTVESTKPYRKKMNIRFVLHQGAAPVLYRIEDGVGSPYAELIIMSNVELGAGKLVVDWSGINNRAAGINAGNYLQVDSTNNYVIDKNAEGDYGLYGVNEPDDKGFLDKITTTKEIQSLESISIYLFKKYPMMDYSTDKDENGKYIDLSALGYNPETGVYTITLTKQGVTNGGENS